jgi:hypothetical protein
MTKEWGLRHGLNPILYVAQQSMLSSSYGAALEHFNLSTDDDIDEWSPAQRGLGDVLRYIKNYEADLTRHGVTIKKYRFSDEREWRYVPPHTEDCDMLVHDSYYDHSGNKAEVDRRLYIIINDDSEIAEFIDHLRRAKGTNYSLNDVERLTTRILTVSQIMSDI